MLCPSSIARAERQKLSKSTWYAMDCVPILSRVAPRLSIYIHSEAPSTQKPAVIFAASHTLELPALRTPKSPKPDHTEHHTRFELVSISARLLRRLVSTLRLTPSLVSISASRYVASP